MSNLAEELAADQPVSRCRICAWIADQPAEIQQEWHTALAKPAKVTSHASILRALLKRKVETSEGGVKRHRRYHA